MLITSRRATTSRTRRIHRDKTAQPPPVAVRGPGCAQSLPHRSYQRRCDLRGLGKYKSFELPSTRFQPRRCRGFAGTVLRQHFRLQPSVVCPWYPTSRARRFASVRRTRARAPKRTGTAGGALSCGAGRACLSSTLFSSRQARRARGWAATSGAAVMLGMGDGRVSLHVPWTTRALCRSLPAPAAAVVRHCAGVCPSFPCLEVEPAAVVARGFAGMRRNLDT